MHKAIWLPGLLGHFGIIYLKQPVWVQSGNTGLRKAGACCSFLPFYCTATHRQYRRNLNIALAAETTVYVHGTVKTKQKE